MKNYYNNNSIKEIILRRLITQTEYKRFTVLTIQIIKYHLVAVQISGTVHDNFFLRNTNSKHSTDEKSTQKF